MGTIAWIFSIIIVILIVYTIVLNRKYKTLTQDNRTLLSQKKSSEVRLGQISEQIAPFIEGFKYDSKNLKFLGQPIDFICFEPDAVVFIEVKSGQSQLSQKQKNIKTLIESKQVYWDEFRISGKTEKSKDNQASS